MKTFARLTGCALARPDEQSRYVLRAPQEGEPDIKLDLPLADGSGTRKLVIEEAMGILQSLIRDKDLNATLASVASVLKPGGLFGVDLVPDVPNWREYSNRVQMTGKAAGGAKPSAARRQPTWTAGSASIQRRSGWKRSAGWSSLSISSATRRLPAGTTRRPRWWPKPPRRAVPCMIVMTTTMPTTPPPPSPRSQWPTPAASGPRVPWPPPCHPS